MRGGRLPVRRAFSVRLVRVLAVTAAVAGGFVPQPLRAAAPGDAGALGTPADYSLAPVAPPGAPDGTASGTAPGLVKGGVVSSSIGSGGQRSSAIRLDSGPLGGGTSAFLALGAGQSPTWRGGPKVIGSSVGLGVQTALPFGSTLTFLFDEEHDRFERGRAPSFP